MLILQFITLHILYDIQFNSITLAFDILNGAVVTGGYRKPPIT